MPSHLESLAVQAGDELVDLGLKTGQTLPGLRPVSARQCNSRQCDESEHDERRNS